MTRARANGFAALLLCGSSLVFACSSGNHGADAAVDGGDGGGKHNRDSGTTSDAGDGGARDASTKDAATDAGVIASTPGQCPGTGTPVPGFACRSDAECNAGNPRCLFNAIPPGCGTCFIGADHLCDKDGDCGSGMVCNPVVESNPCPCNASALPGTRCDPECTSSSCNGSERCESDGHCRIRPCTDGYACDAGFKCDPKNASPDPHGCAPKSCTSDRYKCPDHFVCGDGQNTDVHGCSEVSCKDGFVCPPNSDCNAKSTGNHHCEKRACKGDSDCDCGFCIQAHCEPRLFVCTGAQAP